LADAESQLDEAELIDPVKWFSAHGAKQESLDKFDGSYGCVSIIVGAARESALLCTDIEETSRGHDDTLVYRVVTHQIVRVVRAGKVVTVLDVRTRLESLDGAAPRPGEPPQGIVDLKLSITPDGLSATVDALDPEADCQARDAVPVVKAEGEDAAQERAWAAFDREWETRICNGRGSYIWKGRRFVQAR